jgi:non-ribosomal peptide synthetase-like protein
MDRLADAQDVEKLLDFELPGRSLRDWVLVCPDREHRPRWRDGERLEQLFEDRCDWMWENGRGDHPAVDAGDVVLTYGQLDARANQLARHLLAHGARPGDRIGLLFDQAVHSYIGMLAVLKINASYVPLDVGFPSDRLSYIVQDAGVRLILSLSHLRDRLEHLAATLLCVDEVQALVAAESDRRLSDAEKGAPVDQLCYIVYTSGSTGRPKGVAIAHASICNFVRVAAEVYGIEERDRVYQGMTIAFDFSVEEIWVPLVVGATLVPKPGGSTLLGHELGEYLEARDVTALCCVPTLLATLDEDLPGLRFLLVSGEACPQELIARWHKPGRRFLNVYGPTEATVTATWTAVRPDRPVTIGVPLPTYSVAILDPVEDKALSFGETGEIGIAGIGLALGYVNRDDLTDRAFIRDFIGIENNPSGRIYRTGDLGQINADGEIEYHGRIDTQVKIRGYRIELSEIESVLLQVPGIGQAVASTWEPEPGTLELVAYYSLRSDAAGLDPERVYEHLRKRLPGYMVPAYLEELAVIPMLPSDKADRKRLPPPKSPRSLATQHAYVGPATATEQILADALAQVLRLERVSVDSHFFDELGANSLLMAQFCAKVRQQTNLPPVAMKDVYLHPTIRSLAVALADVVAGLGILPAQATGAAVTPASTASYILCGTLQVLLFLGYSYLGAFVLVVGLEWIVVGTGLPGIYLRSILFGGASLVVLCLVPILAKWLLIGRWKREEFPIWSLAYVRFWLVKVLIRSNPLVLFVGSPIYLLYLRALGARIGRGVAIFSGNMPVCTDLLTIGDGTVIRKDAVFDGYRAQAGRIQTGAVSFGKDVVIGEQTVIDIETSMGDGAQLGHASCLHAFQSVPDGQRWHGSPAQPTDVDYRAVKPARCSTLRRIAYSTLQVLAMFLLAPMGLSVAVLLVTKVPVLAELLGPGHDGLTTWAFYRNALVISSVLFFGGLLLGLAFIFTVPRLLNFFITPSKVYPLYGFHYVVQQAIARMTNSKFFVDLFGDSSYIVHYLRALGYDLSVIEQTGTNFGTELKHDTPYLCSVGRGTMISDGLSIMNADFSSTSFRVSPVSLGARSFFGNYVAYPAGGRTGDNCLLATKVMVPLDGPIRENVGLLGSPSFEIPRSVQRDSRFDRLKTGEEFRRRLAAKNKHNLATMGLFLLIRWIHFAVLTELALAALDLYHLLGALVIVKFAVLALAFSVAYFVLVERAVAGFRALSPQFCSVYESYYWWHERFWKFLMPDLINLFNGTPFKGPIWRLLGVRVGRRLFDNGCGIPEKTLVTIGDDCVLNTGTVIQCHSLEDGTFKSDHVVIGAGCTLGIKVFVHYGVKVGNGATLDADSFLMKGEEVAPHAQWRGNPAREIRDVSAVSPAGVTLAIMMVPSMADTTAPASKLSDRPSCFCIALASRTAQIVTQFRRRSSIRIPRAPSRLCSSRHADDASSA